MFAHVTLPVSLVAKPLVKLEKTEVQALDVFHAGAFVVRASHSVERVSANHFPESNEKTNQLSVCPPP